MASAKSSVCHTRWLPGSSPTWQLTSQKNDVLCIRMASPSTLEVSTTQSGTQRGPPPTVGPQNVTATRARYEQDDRYARHTTRRSTVDEGGLI